MAIGCWGTGLVFSVSDDMVKTFMNLKRTTSSSWATHSRIGKKDEVEFLRPGLQKITFTMELNAMLGVRPRAMLEMLERSVEKGTVNTFVIGGKRVGSHRWRITGTSEEWDVLLNKGELVKASVSVTMEEYL